MVKHRQFLSGRAAHAFSADQRSRGHVFLEKKKIDIEKSGLSRLVAHVTEERKYEVNIEVDGDSAMSVELRVFCSCLEFRTKHLCPHIWATILTVDEAETELEVPGSGQIKVVADKPETAPPVGKNQKNQPQAIVYVAGQKDKSVEAWRKKLSEVEAAIRQDQKLVESLSYRQKRVWYAINLAVTREKEQLVLELFVQDTQPRGGWGKLRGLRLSAADLKNYAHSEDRSVLGFLLGNQPEFDSSQKKPRFDKVVVDPVFYDILLPKLSSTGRFGVISGEDPDEQPKLIKWDPGAAWRFEMTAIPNDVLGGYHLWGHLRRAKETKDMNDAKLYLPSGLVLFQDKLAKLDAQESFRWLDLLRVQGKIHVPAREKLILTEKLHTLPDLPLADLPEDLRWPEVKVTPKPRLSILQDMEEDEYLRCRIYFSYESVKVAQADTRERIPNMDKKNVMPRHEEFEKSSLEFLKKIGVANQLIPKKDLSMIVGSLLDQNWVVEAEGRPVRKPGEFKAKVNSGQDWFDLSAEIEFGDIKANLPQLLAAAEKGEYFVKLGDGTFGMLPEEWLKSLSTLGELGRESDEKLRFSKSQAVFLDALLSHDDKRLTLQMDKNFKNLRDQLHTLHGVAPMEAPPTFQGTLREYQQQGLGWLHFLKEFHLGGCLADDMGLGKTIQVLCLLEHNRLKQTKGKKAPSIAVVPRSLVFNWTKEAAKFTPDMKVLEYAGKDRASLRKKFKEYDLIVMTYAVLRLDIDHLKEIEFDIALLDEAQAIKNEDSKASEAAKLIQSRHRLAVTGTPIENHLGELWSIFEFTNPGMLGKATSGVFAFLPTQGREIQPEKLQLLSKTLRPFILRRTKSQVLKELPEKTEQTIYCELDKEQRSLYKELQTHYRTSLEKRIKEFGMAKSKIHVLEALLRLRQVACHPGLMDKTRIDDGSAKVDAVLEQVEELISEGHKALIFSQFTQFLGIIRRDLDARGINYEYLDGTTKDRQERVDHFQNDPTCSLFLISLKAGGLGLNLTAADYCYLMDPWWNPAVEAQAIDRAHRMGQKRKVFAYRMIARDTVEEKIMELQKGKRQLADAVISDDASFMTSLSMDDLQVLLS